MRILPSLLLVLPVTCFSQSICQIQGAGSNSPFLGQQVTTEGVVTAVFSGAGSVGGYFIEQSGCDADPATSNGVFVYDNFPAAVGQRVSVTATVAEFNGVTELTNADHEVLGTGSVSPTNLELPIADLSQWERYEGMFLRFPGTLTVTDNQDWVQYGQLRLAPERLLVATNHLDPNDMVASGTTTMGAGNVGAIQAENNVNGRSRILLDDGRTSTYPSPLPWIGPENTLRTGSTITDLQGVLHYSFGEFRLEPVGPVSITHNPRPPSPVVSGTLRASGFNVLNYFTTLGDWGAANVAELGRQRTKLVAAMVALNADVFALSEMENTDEAWNDLLNGLNAAVGAGTYSGMEEDGFGAGTRMVIFYKPGVLTPVTQLYWLGSGIFERPHLTQGFQVNSTGGQFLFSTMHLRSKLCDNATGLDLDQGDGQGCYNNRRRAQATALVTHWEGIRNATGIDAQLIMGDFNSFIEEDPIDVLRAAGLQRLLSAEDYSHAYGGEVGALDHAFVTTSMAEAVQGAAVWHINSDEPGALDYSDENVSRYQPSAFRCSDHDPVLVGFNGSQLTVGQEELAPAVDVRFRLIGSSGQWTLAEAAVAGTMLTLFDAQGRQVASLNSTSTVLTQELGDFATGVYLWRLTTTTGRPVATGRFALP